MVSIDYGRTSVRSFARTRAAAALGALAALISVPVGAETDAKPGGSPKPPAAPAGVLKPIRTPIRLSYLYKAGDVRRYGVTAFFSGHIPPFATADSPPVHLMVVLDYNATVKKVTDKGAEVEFVVEHAVVNLLEKEAGEDGKIDPKYVFEFPLPLAQIQKALNATATFKPNGAIAGITGGDTSSVKIDLGIDLRKLFLVTAPIIFADKPVKAGDAWPFDDGLLGSKPGKTTYTGRLIAVGSVGKTIKATLSQQGDSSVESKLDKEGNSTENAAAVVGSLVGKVTLTGTVELVGSADAPGNPGGASGRVTEGKLSMVVLLKRTLPDPDHPEQPDKKQITDIDIQARMFVKPQSVAPKSASAVWPTGASPGSANAVTGKPNKKNK